MAATPKVLARTAATLTTTTVLYTVPASTSTVLSSIVITSGAAAGTFTLGMGPSGAQVPLATTVAISANSIVTLDVKQVLDTTNTITGGASETTINFHISGVEIA
jgi:hypothetical protein